MDRLKQMDCFLRITRSGSFTAVATQLGLSPAAVTRQINALERDLGVRLVNRSTRMLRLTEAGKTYAALCERVVEDVAQCESQLAATQQDPTGSIKMIVPKSFGSMQLADAIVLFSKRHADISISIELDVFPARPNDFVDRGYDMALRWGANIPDSTVVSSHLASLPRKLCAAPQYIAERGAPQTPADLREHNCLNHLGASENNQWFFLDGKRQVGVPVNGDFASDSAIVLRKAVVAGCGLAILPHYCIRDDLQSGVLVEVMTNYPVPPNPLVLLYREKRLLPSRVRMFIDFLHEWFAQHAKTL